MSAQQGVLHGRHSRRVAPECLDSSPDRLGRAGSVASDSPLLQDDANGGADFAAALQERFLHESEFPGNVADDAVTPSPLPNVGAVHTYSPVWHKVVARGHSSPRARSRWRVRPACASLSCVHRVPSFPTVLHFVDRAHDRPGEEGVDELQGNAQR